jgi:hypothetical protein
MAANTTDKFLKVTPNFSTTIGSGGVANGTATTIPLDSVSGLATDTAIELVINRLNSSQQITNNYETIRGTVSGTNIVNCERGVEGTAQAWAAGITVEYLATADIQNRMVDGILVDHAQLGYHKSLTDTNGNEWIKQTATASAVNEFTVANAATGNSPTISATGGDTDIDINLTPKGTGRIKSATVAVPTISSTDTLTNKRITKRVVSAASYTTDTGTSLNCDTTDCFIVTAQAGALKFNNPSGTGTQGQPLLIRILDNGTARALTYDTQFRAMGTALPTTTVLSKTLYMLFIFNETATKWDLVAAGQEA